MADSPTYRCPRCRYKSRTMLLIFGTEHVPAPHDAMVCTRCGAYLQFDDSMQLAEMRQIVLELLPVTMSAAMLKSRRLAKKY